MSAIVDFNNIDIGKDYYSGLLEDLKILNNKFNAFNSINENLNSGFCFSVKDNICVKGVQTTASSKMLDGYIPPFDATVVERMNQKRFGFLGKTNMDEFGFGSFGINCQKVAKNPFDERYVAGGSSSGAAIAAAILKYHVAIAESTGGSISAPSAFCGVEGFTPSYGVVSRYGLIDYANSLDKIGIIARCADDIKQIFEIIKGQDRYDSTCTDAQIKSDNSKNLMIIDEFTDCVDERIKSQFLSFIDKLAADGYNVQRRSIKLISAAIPAYYIIAMAEASTNLAKYTGFKYGFKNDKFYDGYNDFFSASRSNFGAEAKRRIVLGTFVRSASTRKRYYDKAMRIRGMLIDEMNQILKDGFIISPTMPIATPRIEDVTKLSPVQNYKMDVLTIPPNLGGFPHLSIPYNYDNGLPMGAQIITSHFNDYALLEFAREWEKSFEYKFRYNIGAFK